MRSASTRGKPGTTPPTNNKCPSQLGQCQRQPPGQLGLLPSPSSSKAPHPAPTMVPEEAGRGQ